MEPAVEEVQIGDVECGSLAARRRLGRGRDGRLGCRLRDLGLGLCGTNDSHYLEATDARAHEVLLCLQTGAKISDPNRWKFATEEFYLKSAEEMAKVFAHVPGACASTLAVAERFPEP